jgi:Na+-driven multidrug efflux pump
MERMFYLAELIGNLDKACTAIAIIFSIGMTVGWIGRVISSCCSDYTEDDKKAFKQVSKYSTIFGIIFILAALILPSKDTYLLMMGGRVVDLTIEDNPQIKEIPEKTIDLLNAWIEEETKNIKEENEQGDK